MKKITFLLLIFLAFLALFVVGFDYVCGHMYENPFKPDECPICASFNSTEFIHLFLFILLFLGFLPLTGVILQSSSRLPLFLIASIRNGRAPPLP